METQTAKKNAQQDVEVMVNEIIIEQLEKGRVPWRGTWLLAGVPTSLVSKRPFRGINMLLLTALGYERSVFVTPRQLESMSGCAKPDEVPHIITFWSSQQNAPGEAETPGEKKPGMLSYYAVYNVSQCTGIPDEAMPEIVVETNPIRACERIVASMSRAASIRHKESRAFYDPLEDYINMPKMKSFYVQASYYSVLFHQLAHSTGHHTRLDRMGLVQMSEYGCDMHTQEEMVAEIVTTYLECLAGIPVPFVPDDAYIDGWKRKFRSDRHFIFNACTLAQKAIDYILNVKVETEDRPQEEEALSVK